MLFSCGGVLRALSLNTKQLSVYRPIPIRDYVTGVAFDAQTETLLLSIKVLQGADAPWQLVSLRRNSRYPNEWQEVDRISTNYVLDIAVCDSHVLLGSGGRTLYVFNVSADHTLHKEGIVMV